MPIYAYQCTACGAVSEALQKMTDAPLTECSTCGNMSKVRIPTAPRFKLNGAGWYETDFKTQKANSGETNDD